MSEANTEPANRNVIKTVLEIDLASYSDIAQVLEENLDVEAVRSFQDQIQEFVDYGITAVGLDREDVVLATAGDNAILIFDTAVTMHNFAHAVHQETSRHNASKSIALAERWFRMGAATGIVMVVPTQRRIVGVTIARAVRLEAAAKKGQLVIDRETYQKLPKEIQDVYGPEEIIRGKRQERFRGHRCTLVHVPAEAGRDFDWGILRKCLVLLARRRGITVTAVGAIVATLFLAVTAWWVWPMLGVRGTAELAGAVTISTMQPLAAPRLSIVVLPFANFSNDPDQQYFADGVTEDLTTDLSRIAHMFVISRNTAFAYKDKSVNAKQIGRELGVRYVLEGSVQRSAKQVRVNVQLIAAEADAHLWAERFDRDLGDLLALQDDVTRGIARSLDAQLIAAEAARPAEHPDALDYILRGRAAASKGWTRANYARAIGFFKQALALDPHSSAAQGLLANALTLRVLRRQTFNAVADTARAEDLVKQALATSPGSPFAHFVKGQVLRLQGRCQEAIPQFHIAIDGNPNLAAAYGNLGWCKFLTGSIDEAIPLEEQAVRLSPRDPFIGVLYDRIGLAHLLQSRPDEAIVWFQKALLPARPIEMLTGVHLHLASAYALSDDTERAALELAEARKLTGDRALRLAWLKVRQFIPDPQPAPSIRALLDQTYFAGLRKAGMPEE